MIWSLWWPALIQSGLIKTKDTLITQEIPRVWELCVRNRGQGLALE